MKNTHTHHLVWSWSERTAESEGNGPEGHIERAKDSGHTHCDDLAALALPRRLLKETDSETSSNISQYKENLEALESVEFSC